MTLTDLIYNAIVNYKRKYAGNTPSMRELIEIIKAEHDRNVVVSNIKYQIDILVNDGRLVRTTDKSNDMALFVPGSELVYDIPNIRRMALNKNPNRILAFVIGFKLAYAGNTPTYKQIMDGTNITSTSVVSHHINKFIHNSGLLTLVHTSHRNYSLPNSSWTLNNE